MIGKKKVYSMTQKFDFKDITLVPEVISSINSRKEINVLNEDGKLPIMVSPMDTVVDSKNYKIFLDNKLEVCLPRGLNPDNFNGITSVSLEIFEDFVEWYSEVDFSDEFNILIDIANGHMEKLYTLVKKFSSVKKSPNHKLYIGNIANPKTYEKFARLGVNGIRVGIGGGSGCLTSANTGIHYPMASLIHECYLIKKKGGYTTKIIADGGFKNFDDIIKALSLGADYVMLGGALNKCLESCSTTKLFKLIPLCPKRANFIWDNIPFLRRFFYKHFRGMSTKEVQKKWGKSILTTSEGIYKTNKVEYKLSSWVENFEDYLKSAMSYTDSKTLEEFKETEYIFITENALHRYHK